MKNLKASFIAIYLLISINILNAQIGNQFAFTCNPFLQNMSLTGVTVFWEVSASAYSWIDFGETESLGSKAVSIHNGMTDVSSGIQKIRLENLKDGRTYYYRAASCEVKTLEPYKVIYGDTIFSKIYKFKLPAIKDNKFTFLAFNDLHNKPQFIEDVVKKENDFNFAVFNGDILTDLNDESSYAKKIFAPLSSYAAGEKPLYFIRGNHETRGGAARNLYKYIDTPGGKYYYTFTRGNTFFIMLDCGEDKPDNNKNYYGLANYDSYRTEEAKWLETVVKSAEFRNAKFRIVCIHMPIKVKPAPDTDDDHGIYECSVKFAPILNKAGIDLLLCGHTHKYEVVKAGKESNRFPMIVGGRHFDSKSPEKTTYTRVEISPNKISAVLKHADGKEIEKVEIKK